MAPLDGVKVIEAANYIAGPFGGMILADLGADVIKVEPPRGDPYRRLGRPYGDSSLQFKAANQNKQSVTVDLKTESGMAQLFELLEDADVLITNWRPAAAERMGLTAERIRRDYPQLIWVRVSGYGPDGPREPQPAYDSIIQARSGALLLGTERPMNTNNNVADKVSAMFAAQTVTAALHQRSRTGTGVVCDVPMVDAMAYFYGGDASSGHRITGQEPDEAIANTLINDLTMETADGYLALSPVSGRQLRRAMEAAGVGDQFAKVMDADRSRTIEVFTEVMGEPLRQRAALEWEEIFDEADVPAAAVRSFDQHIADPQTEHLGTYTPVADDSLDGDWLLVRYPALFDGERVDTAEQAAPRLQPLDDEPG